PPTLGDRLQHILEAIAHVEKAVAGKMPDDLANDAFLNAAVERFLEKISEASRYIPEERKGAADISWQRMADLGNWLRHAYHRVNTDIVWQIIVNDLPRLKRLVEQVVRYGETR